MILSVDLEDNEQQILDVVFSGTGPMPHARDVLRDHLASSGDYIKWVIEVRHYLAASGAMRWPWSQEAPIYELGAGF